MTAVRRLSLPTMVAFGLGQCAEGIKNQAFNVFLVFYYQQVIGLPGWMTGLALGIALDRQATPGLSPVGSRHHRATR